MPSRFPLRSSALAIPGLAVLALGIFAFPSNAAPAPSTVGWRLLPEYERALPGHPPHSESQAHLFAAGGEYQAFQIAIPAPSSGLLLTGAVCSDLAGATPQRKIAAANVTLYREHYVHVDAASPDWHGANRSLGPGWYPDPLIPFRDPKSGKALSGTYRAVPFHADPNTILALWVDVFVPRGTPGGEYRATITLSSDHGKMDVPWTLTVWRFDLPLKPSLRSSFLFWNPVGRDAIEELLRHRLMPETIPARGSGPAALERELSASLGLSMTGAGFWSGADNSHCSMQPAPAVSELRKAAASHDPDLFLFNYTADEIQNCRNLPPDLRAWGHNLHEAHIQNLVVMAPEPGLDDDGSGTGRSAVDIWVLLPMQLARGAPALAAARARGNQIWSYNAVVQDGYSPKWLIDYDLLDYRLQAGFLSQTMGLTGLLYWRIDRWEGDVWNQVNNEGAFSSGNYPGEGLLVYPGGPVGLPGSVVPSLRLKQLREGVQDFEYVELLKHLGRGDWALKQIHSIAPDWTNWTRSGDALESVRRELGAEIERLSTPAR